MTLGLYFQVLRLPAETGEAEPRPGAAPFGHPGSGVSQRGLRRELAAVREMVLRSQQGCLRPLPDGSPDWCGVGGGPSGVQCSGVPVELQPAPAPVGQAGRPDPHSQGPPSHSEETVKTQVRNDVLLFCCCCLLLFSCSDKEMVVRMCTALACGIAKKWTPVPSPNSPQSVVRQSRSAKKSAKNKG